MYSLKCGIIKKVLRLVGILIIILSAIFLLDNTKILETPRSITSEPPHETDSLSGLEPNLIEESPVNSKGNKLILIWNKYWSWQGWYRVFQRISENKCEVSNCVFTTNKLRLNESDAVLFHLIDVHNELYKFPNYRNPKQNWVIMDYETPYVVGYSGVDVYRLNNIFNRTMNYRNDADVTVRYGEVRKFSERNLKRNNSDWVDSHDDIRFRNYAANKTHLIAWFASSHKCKSQSRRELYVHELQKVVPVHIYGQCGTYKCGTRKVIKNPYTVKEDECYKLVSETYKFYLSFENSLCKDYVTEKLFNILRLNVIPIVFGKANYSAVAPPHSVIDATKFKPAELGAYIKLLDSNDTLYNEYFNWKSDFEVIGYNSVPNPCDLCKKLNSVEWKTQQKTIKNFTEWFVDKSECIAGYRPSV